DLQSPLQIEKVTQDGQELEIAHNGNAHFIQLEKQQKIGEFNEIIVTYSGHPKEAIKAPWDGGFSWKKDENGKDFVATSCQGLGASVWWPNKDHMYDEVDSMLISVKAPKGLMNVSNGRLRKIDGNTNTYHWFVSNPINNYGVNVNIGDYVHFGEKYDGEKGDLDMDYYVLNYNLEKARKHFKDAPKMMEAFENWFGPYPFYEDSFKLVEVPYLGMEHQSSVTYGNQYINGYLGRDLSGSGWGLKFDFIIIHEAGHEWFANNITYKDAADMWVHEGFTCYSESLFLDYHYGTEAANAYVQGIRKNIKNDRPIIGIYDVNHEGSGDMYYKGSNILHTLRQVVNDDAKWRAILRGLNSEFYHKTVTTDQIEHYISMQMKRDLRPFFNQYLRTTKIPVFEYSIKRKKLMYRYSNTVEGFSLPLRILIEDKPVWLEPTTTWQTQKIKGNLKTITIDPNFYIDSKLN
ncbi:MAG: M1 family metallopeptidase, partial [Maribacter arcticus]|uniref:M1 family metallopeptidase n=1 Tax=Maribacter arcticus TaxID=561365 RepID=UPI0030022BA5